VKLELLARQQMVEHIDIWLSQCQDPDHGAIFWRYGGIVGDCWDAAM